MHTRREAFAGPVIGHAHAQRPDRVFAGFSVGFCVAYDDLFSVGIAQLDGQAEQYQNIQNVLRQRYDVRVIKLNDAVPVDIQAILMGGISDSLTTNENKNLSEFMNRGGNIFIAQNRIKTNLQIQQAFPIESDIFSILEEYGFSIEANLVTDKICGRVNVQQQMGPIRMNVPMEYPLLPIVRNFNADEPIVSGLEQMQLIFPSEIKQDSSSIGQVRFTPLFFTSEQSGELKGTFNLSPDPKQNPFIQMLGQKGKILAATSRLTNGGELMLISDSGFLSDEAGMALEENIVFIMNAVDYLVGDQDLISLRSREVTSRPLDILQLNESEEQSYSQDEKDKMSDRIKKRWKFANMLLPSILIIGFGLFRMRKEKNEAEVLKQIYD